MTKEEITRQQLEAVRDHLMIQYGSVLFLTLAFLVFVLLVFFVVFNLRRCALACSTLIGALTFLVPTPVTFYLSPVIVLASFAGIIWISLRKRAAQRLIAPSAATAVPRQATPASL